MFYYVYLRNGGLSSGWSSSESDDALYDTVGSLFQANEQAVNPGNETVLQPN